MAAEFVIPAKPEDLADEDCVLEFKICRLTALESLAASAVENFAEGGRAVLTDDTDARGSDCCSFSGVKRHRCVLQVLGGEILLCNIRFYLCRSSL